MAEPLHGCIYCRISDDRAGEGEGVARQEADCRALADRLGIIIDAVYIDNSKSAWKRNRKRPDWDRMMQALADRQHDAVITWHGDRLMRQPRDLEDLLDVADRGVKVISPGGHRDLSSADDRFILRIEVAHACRSSDDTSRRTQRKHLELAQQGRPVGGRARPFGYDDDKITVRPDERQLVQEAAANVLAGGTVRAVTKSWNERGLVTPLGNRWSQTAVRRVLTAWRSAGIRSLDDTPVATGAWEPLLDVETHARLRALLLAPGRTRGGYGPRTHVLTGLLVCWKCGHRLIARPQSNRRRTYVCTSNPDKGGCGGVRIVADDLEQFIVETVLSRVESPDFAQAVADRQRSNADDHGPSAASEVLAAEHKLQTLAQQWAADEITDLEWATARKALDERLAAARKALARTNLNPQLHVDGEGLRARWETLDIDQRHALLRVLIDRIVVGPATPGWNRFDHRRVHPDGGGDVIWKV